MWKKLYQTFFIWYFFLWGGYIGAVQAGTPPNPPPAAPPPASHKFQIPSKPLKDKKVPFAPLSIKRECYIKQPIGKVVLRGLPYEDHSKNTCFEYTKNQGGLTIPKRSKYISVRTGEWFKIVSLTLSFTRDSRTRIILQDINKTSEYGVTAFKLRDFRLLNRHSIIVRIPPYPIFRNRTFHVSVAFIEGPPPWKHAYVGTLKIK